MAIQWLRGLASAFTSANPTLLPGQAGVEYDTGKFKIGRSGGTPWNSGEYVNVTPAELDAKVGTEIAPLDVDTERMEYTFLPAPDATRIDFNHLRRGEADRGISAGLVREALKAPTWFEDWADDPDPAVWDVAGSPIISGGTMYGAHCSIRPIEYDDVGSFLKGGCLARVSFKTGEAADRTIGIVLSTSDAANIAGGGFLGTYFIGIDATPGNEGRVLIRLNDFVAHVPIWGETFDEEVDVAPGDGEWLLGASLDEVGGLALWARRVDGLAEPFERVITVAVSDLAGWKPTHFGILSSDTRGAAGSGIQAIGYRGSHAPISPSTGLLGTEHTVWAGTRGDGESAHLIIPKIYTGDTPLPVIFHCHGGGGDGFDPTRPGLINQWEEFADAGCFVFSGDFSAVSGNKYSSGADESIERVVDWYMWFRDRFRLGPLVFTGYSMGGIVVLRTISDGRIPVTAALVGDPLQNMEWLWAVHNSNPWAIAAWDETAEGWGFDAGGSYEQYRAAVDSADVWKYDVRRFRGIPLVYMCSPDDTVVDHELNGIGMYEKMAALGLPVALWTTSGDHGQAGTWPVGLMLGFIGTISFTTGMPYGD